MYAVIHTGGKQYRVAEGDRLDVELLSGDDVTLQPVLLVDGDQVLSTPEMHNLDAILH
jgi:large subunit ribosomal protein L21